MYAANLPSAAGLAEQQDRGIGGGDLLGQDEGAPDGRAAPTICSDPSARRFLTQVHVLALESLAQALHVLERLAAFERVHQHPAEQAQARHVLLRPHPFLVDRMDDDQVQPPPPHLDRNAEE